MTVLFIVLIILISVILGFIILIQNPKGGGLAGDFGGVSSQFMGVKQTNDILEKGTWVFASLIGVLCLLSTFFIAGKNNNTDSNGRLQDISTTPVQQPQTNPANAVPFNTPATAPAAKDSGK